MQRGPKPQTAVTKAKRGTLRRDRDGEGPVSLVATGDPPTMPDYLQPEAEEVWLEEISRVMTSGGITELDSSLFATYCSTEALVRKAFKQQQAPPASYLTELRRMRELLGIAGPRVRTGSNNGKAQDSNPFAKNGRRLGQ